MTILPSPTPVFHLSPNGPYIFI